MAGSAEQQFEVAVRLIQSLPKQGPYRPANAALLRFYSLYKQATLGPCSEARPGFWDPVGRAKWDAWSSLGAMPREAAMREYVEELRRTADSMPQSAEVQQFLRRLDDAEQPAAVVNGDCQEASDDEFCDTVAEPPVPDASRPTSVPLANQRPPAEALANQQLERIGASLSRLEADVQRLHGRLDRLERAGAGRWPIAEPAALAACLLWPVALQLLLWLLRLRRRRAAK